MYIYTCGSYVKVNILYQSEDGRTFVEIKFIFAGLFAQGITVQLMKLRTMICVSKIQFLVGALEAHPSKGTKGSFPWL
jgi:hypothetical protein